MRFKTAYKELKGRWNIKNWLKRLRLKTKAGSVGRTGPDDRGVPTIDGGLDGHDDWWE